MVEPVALFSFSGCITNANSCTRLAASSSQFQIFEQVDSWRSARFEPRRKNFRAPGEVKLSRLTPGPRAWYSCAVSPVVDSAWQCSPHRRRRLMSPLYRRIVAVAATVLILVPGLAFAAVEALFDLSSRATSPFPSDRFTVDDHDQNTGVRVNLPKPNCTANPSDCADIDVINTLDGFNLQPRLSIPFSGPIDVSTVNSQTIFLIKLNDPTAPRERGGQIVGINQVAWDVATTTLHVESDELLEQHTRYALIVTRGVHDADGLPVEPSAEFESFRHDLN